MIQGIMNNVELENLEKAGRFRKKVDKNKEKVMEMLKMNGPEYLPIQAGKAGLVIDEPSLKRRKLEIDDLAEKAQIIKQARETQYQLSRGRELLERKQGEFFEKQALPFQKTIKDPNDPNYLKPIGEVIRDSAEENRRQLDIINANLELNGFSLEKIQGLQESLASIVEVVDVSSDKLEDIKMLIADVSTNISKIPAYKDDRPVIESSIGKGLLPQPRPDDEFGLDAEPLAAAAAVDEIMAKPAAAGDEAIMSKPIEYAGPPLPISESEIIPRTPAILLGGLETPATARATEAETPATKRGRTPPSGRPPTSRRPTVALREGAIETKAEPEPVLKLDKIVGFQNEFNDWLQNVSGTIKRPERFAQDFRPWLSYYFDKYGITVYGKEGSPDFEDLVRVYSERAARFRRTTGGPVVRVRQPLSKPMGPKPMGGNGIKVKGLSGRGWNEAYQQYASSNKTIDDISRLRDNLRKSLYGRGNDIPYGRTKSDITRQIHKDFLAKNYKIGKGLSRKPINYSKMNPEQLMKNLTLNIASMKAGNNGVKDQINSIIDQMLEKKIIKKAEHKRLWYELVDA